MSLQPDACKALEKTHFMAVLGDTGLDLASGFMAYFCSATVNWAQGKSLLFPYDFTLGEFSDVLSRSESSTCRRYADGEPIGDPILPAFPVFFYLGTSLC